MKIRRRRIKLNQEIQENVPLFYNYIDIVKKNTGLKLDILLKESNLYDSLAIIEAPSKLISGIIDYSLIKKDEI